MSVLSSSWQRSPAAQRSAPSSSAASQLLKLPTAGRKRGRRQGELSPRRLCRCCAYQGCTGLPPTAAAEVAAGLHVHTRQASVLTVAAQPYPSCPATGWRAWLQGGAAEPPPLPPSTPPQPAPPVEKSKLWSERQCFAELPSRNKMECAPCIPSSSQPCAAAMPCHSIPCHAAGRSHSWKCCPTTP